MRHLLSILSPCRNAGSGYPFQLPEPLTELVYAACAMAEDVTRVWVVGTATSVPGRTKQEGAQIIVDALHKAAQGDDVLEKMLDRRVLG